MFGFWKSRRARSAARAMIGPLLSQSMQRGTIPETAFHDPYIIGFLSMLITLVATRQVGAIGEASLAAVQAKAWTEITGTDGALVGEEICFLSAGQDRAFDLGCRNASNFFLAVTEACDHAATDDFADPAALPAPYARVTEGKSSLWRRYFDAYIGSRTPVTDDL
jgi:hypothetical protein